MKLETRRSLPFVRDSARRAVAPNVVRNAAGKAPEILIYDDIGPDWAGMISGETVTRALAQIGKVPELIVRINSLGGDVFESQAIYNALKRYADRGSKVTIEIDSIAASGASLVAMAGSKIRIAENALLMIHNSLTIAAGHKEDLRATADILEKIDGNLAPVYAAKSGLPVDQIKTLLDAETWFTAAEAVESGLADEISQPVLGAVTNRVPAGRFKNTPKNLTGGEWTENILRLCEETRQRLGIAAGGRWTLEEIERKNNQLRQRYSWLSRN